MVYQSRFSREPYRMNLYYLYNLYIYIYMQRMGSYQCGLQVVIHQSSNGLFIPPGWMSQLVFIICQNPEVGSNSSEEMDLQSRSRKQEQKLPSFIPLHRLPSEGLTQIKGGSPHLKRFRLKVGVSTSNDLTQIPHRCTQQFSLS